MQALQGCKRHRVHAALRVTACGVGVETPLAKVIHGHLSQDATGSIARAQKKHVIRVPPHWQQAFSVVAVTGNGIQQAPSFAWLCSSSGRQHALCAALLRESSPYMGIPSKVW